MNKRVLFIILAVILAISVASGAYAAGSVYINGNNAYDGALSNLYAVGSGGVAKLGSDTAWVLTAAGLQTLSASATPEATAPPQADDINTGLVYTNGEVRIKSNVVKVGLNYYYSANRDSSLAEARLENDVGSGYAFGYFDGQRCFVELGRTACTRLSMRVTSGSGIGVYSGDSGELLYELEKTDSGSMLGIMPLCKTGDAVTWFAQQKYYGGFEYAVLGGGKISVINVVDIEKYVMGVCASEMGKSWPVEALKAQAVAARTYVQKNIKSTTYYSRCGFDVTNDTYCQAYSGCGKLGENIVTAVEATKNQYLTYNGIYIDALYFSSDGGATEDNVNVNGNNSHPYLKGVVDPYEYLTDSINYLSSWRVTFTPAELAARMDLNGEVVSVVPSFSAMGNVIKLVFTSSSGQTASLSRGSCRTGLGLYSIRYTVSTDAAGNFVFDGHGYGHNLGMSQYGAYSMAKYFEKNYKEILGFYYTGVGLSYGVN